MKKISAVTYFRRLTKIKGKTRHSGRGFFECTSDKEHKTYEHALPFIQKLVVEGKAEIVRDDDRCISFTITDEKVEDTYNNIRILKYPDYVEFYVFY